MAALTLFVSYSHENAKQHKKLLTHLSSLRRAGHRIEVWSDQLVDPGADWRGAIGKAMADARIAILLITAEFLASDFILDEEIPILLERRRHAGLRVFPVLARACAWQNSEWLSELQLWPRDGKPVWRSGRSPDDELARLALEVKAVAEILVREPSAAAQPDEREQQVREVIDESRTEAERIFAQIARDAPRLRQERQQIMRETERKIFALTQPGAGPPRKADRAFDAWDKYIKGEG